MTVPNETNCYDSLMQVITARRSLRLFEPRPVPRELVLQALEAARWAPSGANIQPWEFLVVDEASLVRQVADLLIQEREYLLAKDPSFPPLGRAFHRDVRLYVLVLGDTRLKKAFPQTTDFAVDVTLWASLAMATCQLHLAVHALGLGTYFNTPEEPTEAALKELLSIPEHMRLFSIAPIGFPRTRRTSSRRPLEEMVHWNGYQPALGRDDAEVAALLQKRVVALAMSGRWEQAAQEARALCPEPRSIYNECACPGS